jgi:NhaA family Na+:H+ antiporter
MSRVDLFKPPEGEDKHHKYHTQLEGALAGPISSFNEFISHQITTSVLLVTFALVAILWASIDFFGDTYHLFQKFQVGIKLGNYTASLNLKHFVNNLLMALFFFLLGLEVKREFIAGELGRSDVRNTVIFAALGGMLVPAFLFITLSPDQYDLKGWGIPIATDTAFALGVLALLRNRLPASIFSFIAALAVIDDIGAISVLAIFYIDPLDPFYVLLASSSILTLVFFNMAGIRKYLPYLIVGFITWVFVENAGLHGTVAGVLVALTIPARPKTGPKRFIQNVDKLTTQLERSEDENDTTILEDDQKQDIIGKVEDLAVKTASPLSRLQHMLEPSIYIFVLPLFALLNTGIPISIDRISDAFGHTLTQNIFISLLFGKLLGITFFTWLICKCKLGKLPEGMTFGHIIGLSLLAGIGFTMSIFIAEMGFGDSPDMIVVKTGIFAASITAAISGFLFLYIYSLRYQNIPKSQE